MRKIFYLLSLIVPLIAVNPASANFVTTLDFDGFYHYSGAGDIAPTTEVCQQGYGGDLLECGGTSSEGFYGVGAFAYELGLNLPNPNSEYSWWLEIDLMVSGEYFEWDSVAPEPVEILIEDKKIPLGHFALGITEQDVADFLDSIPKKGYIGSVEDTLAYFGAQAGFSEEEMAYVLDGIPDGLGSIHYLFEGDTENGLLLAAIGENVLNYTPEEYDWGNYSGQLVLTALSDDSTVIPEPATMLLFGAGLLGAFVRRKRT